MPTSAPTAPFDVPGTDPASAGLPPEEAPVILWTTTREGACHFVDHAWQEFTGQPLLAALGDGWLDVVHPDDREATRRRLQEATASRRSLRQQYRVRRHDGSWRWCLTAAAPRRADDGTFLGHVGAVMDIHAQAVREARLRESLVALERAGAEAERQRAAAAAASEAKTRFVATMSHELRTPLNAIQGHVQLLLLGLQGALTDVQRETLRRVQRAERHVATLIDEVLDLARLEAGKEEFTLAPVAVGEVVQAVLPLVETQLAGAGLTLDLPTPDEAATHVLADRERLGQVLINLLTNAIKFTPLALRAGETGRIAVTVDRPAGPPPRVAVHVTDTGPGIAPADHEAIFDPFVQLDHGVAAPRSTGLGLAISRELARGMGGDLIVRSAPGAGSTFTILLPAPPDDAR
jgi:PAS domain S-box-containing protein